MPIILDCKCTRMVTLYSCFPVTSPNQKHLLTTRNTFYTMECGSVCYRMVVHSKLNKKCNDDTTGLALGNDNFWTGTNKEAARNDTKYSSSMCTKNKTKARTQDASPKRIELQCEHCLERSTQEKMTKCIGCDALFCPKCEDLEYTTHCHKCDTSIHSKCTYKCIQCASTFCIGCSEQCPRCETPVEWR